MFYLPQTWMALVQISKLIQKNLSIQTPIIPVSRPRRKVAHTMRRRAGPEEISNINRRLTVPDVRPRRINYTHTHEEPHENTHKK